MNLGDTVPMGTSLQIDPVAGTGGTATYGIPVSSQYFCDDGSIAVSGVCNDGSTATFVYSDPNGSQCDVNSLVDGYCPALAVSTGPLSTGFSSSTLLLIGVALAALWWFNK